jgi:hypothetical protein
MKTIVCLLTVATKGTGKEAVELDFVNVRAYSVADGANPSEAKPVDAYEFTLDGAAWVGRAKNLKAARQNAVFAAEITSERVDPVKDAVTGIVRPKTDFGVPCRKATVELKKLIGLVDWKTSSADASVMAELDQLFATP